MSTRRSPLLAALLATALLSGCGASATTALLATPTVRYAEAQPATPAIPIAAVTAGSNSATVAAAAASAPATSAASPAPAPSAAAATETIIDYYRAISERRYAAAFGLWDQAGAASGQTLATFTAGFTNTVEVQVVAGAATTGAGFTTVPVTVTAIENRPDGAEQAVQHFHGTYQLVAAAGQARIASAALSADADAAAPDADALTVLQRYYAALNARQYAAAYSMWNRNGQASEQRFTAFAQGFAATEEITLTSGEPVGEGAAGSLYTTIPVVISARQADGSAQTFCGSYTLRRLNVPPFEVFGWRLEQGELRPVSAQPSSAEIARLLSAGCQP